MFNSTKKDGDSREQIRAHEYIREEIARELGLDPDRFPGKRISVGDSFYFLDLDCSSHLCGIPDDGDIPQSSPLLHELFLVLFRSFPHE